MGLEEIQAIHLDGIPHIHIPWFYTIKHPSIDEVRANDCSLDVCFHGLQFHVQRLLKSNCTKF